jgi:alkylation response protein AidB-like acyl-CoA dehydrogenase
LSADATMETVADFRRRAAGWIEAHLPSTDDPVVDGIELQRTIFDGGFAGIAFPTEYGGAGLTLDHHQAFFDAAAELRRQVPTGTPVRVSVTMIGPTILDMGSHEAKLRFLPRLLRGDDVWIQVLSEPQGGSDLAGAITALTPDPDGEGYRLNGSKMWSSGAMGADWGLCLCRSDWSVPKHQGLTMVAVPLQDTPGLTVRRTLAVDGQPGNFCEEFFDDVAVPTSHVIGDVNAGWSVAHSLLRHERNSIGGIEHGYGFLGGPDPPPTPSSTPPAGSARALRSVTSSPTPTSTRWSCPSRATASWRGCAPARTRASGARWGSSSRHGRTIRRRGPRSRSTVPMG